MFAKLKLLVRRWKMDLPEPELADTELVDIIIGAVNRRDERERDNCRFDLRLGRPPEVTWTSIGHMHANHCTHARDGQKKNAMSREAISQLTGGGVWGLRFPELVQGDVDHVPHMHFAAVRVGVDGQS